MNKSRHHPLVNLLCHTILHCHLHLSHLGLTLVSHDHNPAFKGCLTHLHLKGVDGSPAVGNGEHVVGGVTLLLFGRLNPILVAATVT